MLLMVGKGIRIRGAICQAIQRYAKANNKYMKGYDKSKESSDLKYWDINNLYGWAMSQKLPVNNVEWVEDISRFNEISPKTIMKKVKKDTFLKLMFNIVKNYMNFIMIYHFLQERIKNEKIEKLVANLHDKTECIIHKRN